MKRKRRRKDRLGGSGVSVGVAWYSRESWQQLREIASDPELLEPTYDAWLEMANVSLTQMHAARLFPQKVELDITRLAEWCRKAKRPLDAAARAAFAAQSMRLKHETPHRLGSV